MRQFRLSGHAHKAKSKQQQAITPNHTHSHIYLFPRLAHTHIVRRSHIFNINTYKTSEGSLLARSQYFWYSGWSWSTRAPTPGSTHNIRMIFFLFLSLARSLPGVFYIYIWNNKIKYSQQWERESGGVGSSSKGGRSIWLQSQGEAYRTELLLFEPIVVKIIAFE